MELAVAEPDEPYWRGLHESLYAGSDVLPKSAPFASYDIYHDLVTPHLERGRTALAAPLSSAPDKLDTMSFDALHLRSNAQSAQWIERGVEPEQIVLIVSPPGPELLVSLLTGWRLGAVVSWVPPLGPAFIANRHRALKPDHVFAPTRYAELLQRVMDPKAVLPGPSGAAGTPVGSHTYASSAVAAKLFSPLSETPDVPVELTVDELFLPQLRDGRATLLAKPGDQISAPGFDILQYQPWLMLATISAGATWVELSEADVQRHPDHLAALTVAGVTERTRNRVLDRSALGKWRLWFKSPVTPIDWRPWHDFGKTVAKHGGLGFNLDGNAAAGGALVCSDKAPDVAHQRIRPAPGLPWQVSDANLTGSPASGDSGFFTALLEEGDARSGRLIVAKSNDQWLCPAVMIRGRGASVYPAREVAAVAELHEAVTFATAHVQPSAERADGACITVVAFVDPALAEHLTEASALIERQIRGAIDTELGTRYGPDRVELYPLHPRFDPEEGRPDEAWCKLQFASGALDRKRRLALFRFIASAQRIAHQRSSELG